MFQAVLVGCILINFFIYDPLLYFLKKLAGAKNLLDLHAGGRVSNVRYMQECIKMKRSQSLQNGCPGLPAAFWVKSLWRGLGLYPANMRLPWPQGCSEQPLDTQVGGRWWPHTL